MHRSVPLDRFQNLPAADTGLTIQEVEERSACYGRNLISEAPSRGWLSLLQETARDPMLWFLVGTGGLFASVGQWAESAVLLAALVPFLGMDFYLNRRTRASLQGLSSRLATRATVMRGGQRQVIESVALVPGDLVALGPGDAIPADGLFVHGERMQVDESTLSGEAFPVRKQALAKFPGNRSEASVDAEHWGFAGTRLLTGEGSLRVAYTGGETWYGEIIRSATIGAHGRTPLQEAVARLVVGLSLGAGLICAVVAWVRYQQGHGLLDALLSALTLAVAALPEEFPVVLAIFLGVGVYRLAKKQALVRRAVVVENIGRVSCICTDKTGTITEGHLVLAHRLCADGVSDERLLQLAAATSRTSGDPMDGAILENLGHRPLAWTLEEDFPFTEDRKRATGVVSENGRLLAAVKGAPEIVLAQCDVPVHEKAYWLKQVDEFAGTGHKVVACAWRELDTASWSGGEPDRDFRIAGLMCFEDPLRPGVREALQACQNAGIRVVMVTGDHPATARAIAREAGLGAENLSIVEGDEMAAQLGRGDVSGLRYVDVVARAIPAHKLALVRALQAGGDIVAVTGDGVNDVPALLASDIGIAMGERGTRSAREVAAIVLLDDNFRTIVSAIAEGRQLFANLQLSFQYLLMIHLPIVVTAAAIPLAGYPLLYLPIHIVWLEVIIHPTALLVFQELSGRGPLSPVRRDPRLTFFNRRQWLMMASVGTLISMIVAATYVRSLGTGYDVEHARAMAMVVLTTASAGITTSLATLKNRAAQITVVGTIALSFLLVQTPALARLLHMKPLHADDWVLAIGGGLLASLLAAMASARGRKDGI